jgi:hypothetical protein
MKYLFLPFMLIIVTCSNILAQQYQKVLVNPADSISGYYLAAMPASKQIDAVLFLLDGFGGSAEGVFSESKLPNAAYGNNVLTISACMGQKIYADSAVINKLNLLLSDIKKRFTVGADQFVIGGFSAGGTITLRYTELCKEWPTKYPVHPKAVFTVDSPVDLIDLWTYFGQQIEKNYNPMAAGEASFVSALMMREHGSPATNPELYQWLTPFNMADKKPGNERFLKDIPVRVYHDVDIVWRLQNRLQSGYDANFLNASELILRLMVMKNNAAEFVKGRIGYRSNGMRHPHSWNIVDEVECLEWLKKIVNPVLKDE